MKKKVLLFLMAVALLATLCTVLCVSASAETLDGFVDGANGEIYYYENGTQVHGWFTSEGVQYYAKASTGEVLYDESQKIGGKFYFWNVDTGFVLANGFYETEAGTICYYEGRQVTGWRHADGTGPALEGTVYEQYWTNPNGLYYFLSTTGVMVTDESYTLGGYIREFNADHTVKAINGMQLKLGVKYYYVNGTRQIGWHTDDATGNTYYFLSTNAQAAAKWMTIGNQIYYFYASTSTPAYALKTSGSIGGIAYEYAADGHILYNGFVNCDYANVNNKNSAAYIQYKNATTRYYVDGVMQTGWQQIGGDWYYFYAIGSANGSGYMCVESRTIGGLNYTFGADGVCSNKETPTVTVTFENDGNVVATVEVAVGTAMNAADLPAAPEKTGYLFTGWLNGDVLFDAAATVSASVTYTASWVKDIAPVTEYVAAWIDTVNHAYIMFTNEGDVVKATLSGADEATATYNEEDGSIAFTATYAYTATIANGQMTVTTTYYDRNEEDYVTVTYTMTKCELVDYAGTYMRDKNTKIVVNEYGIVTECNGTLKYGYMYPNANGGYTIDSLTTYGTTVNSFDVVMDANGIDATGVSSTSYRGYFIKNVDSVIDYYNGTEYDHIYVFTVGDDTIAVYAKSGSYAYATIGGTIADGAILSVAYGNVTTTVKFSGTSFSYAGAEAGTYTNGADTIVLDGFGNAVINGAAAVSYNYYTATNHVVTDSAAYTIDTAAMTYTAAAAVGFSGNFNCFNSTNYWLYLNGYGDAILTYKSSYSNSIYAGTYTVNGTSLTVAGTSYSYNGVYTIEQNGEVLIKSSNNYVMILEGATVENHKADFDGNWTNGSDTFAINTTNNTVTFNGTAATSVKYNYNGTAMTFTLKFICADDYFSTTAQSREFTLTLVDGNLNVAHECSTGWHEYGEYLEFVTKTATYTKVTFDKTVFDGTWNWNYTDINGAAQNGTIVIDSANNSVLYNGAAVTNVAFVGDTLTFNAKDTCDRWPNVARAYTLTVVDGQLVIKHQCGDWDEYYEDVEFHEVTNTATKQEVAEVLDAFAGTWTSGSNTLVFDGKGNVTYNGGSAMTYTVSGNVATFANSTWDFTATLGTNLSVLFDDYDYPFTLTFTKAA